MTGIKKVKLICPDCEGSGKKYACGEYRCITCKGKGKVSKKQMDEFVKQRGKP